MILLALTLLLQTPAAPQAQPDFKMTEVQVGHGKPAQAGDVITVLYKGTLTDGKVFDENQSAGKVPFAFVLGQAQVIRGWDLGMNGIKEGGKRHLVIPPVMGYGDKEVGPIPKNSTLEFDVEALRIDHAGDKANDEIKVLQEGHGAAVKPGDTAQVLYKGSFINGTKFDASEDHPDKDGKVQPISVPIGQKKVIPGFEQAVMGMKVGEKRRVVIPYSLGYGVRGAGGVIPPYSTLVFELELVSTGQPQPPKS